ncbi:MAG: hypothetical protein KIT16_04015 [Rhodospirillaceae bacterium]|nr:hypothetical protein [Rhodospirillaceae bacterium]
MSGGLKRNALLGGVAALAVVAAAPVPVLAQDDLQRLRQEMATERARFQRVMGAYERRIRQLEQRTQELEKKRVDAPPPPLSSPPADAAPPRRTGPAPTFSINSPIGDVDFRIGAVVTGAASVSSAANRITQFLMPGHHDPLGNGFSLQGAELMIEGIVDPYFDGVVRASFKIDSDGETETELEEAYMRTRNLPWGLQVKAGQFYTEFGRINPTHPHEWAFVNQNVIISRLFGEDGMRGLGAQVSWLTPLPWYSQLILSVQNGKGGSMKSFLGEEGDEIGPAVQAGRDIRTFAQLVKLVRWVNGFDLSREVAANIGASFAFGDNATGTGTRTYIAGGDIYVKWTPERNTRGFPFVSAQFEFLHRWFEASVTDADTGELGRQTLRDSGLYLQLLYGFRPDWVAGFRLDYATANGDSRSDPFRDLRWRFSPNLTWYPTERSKIRLQYDYDWAQHLGRQSTHTVMVQFEFSLGAHGAHKF